MRLSRMEIWAGFSSLALEACRSQGRVVKTQDSSRPHESVRDHAVRKPPTPLNPTQALGAEALQSGAPHCHCTPRAGGTRQQSASLHVDARIGGCPRHNKALPRRPRSHHKLPACHYGGPPGSSPTSTSTGTKGEESPRAPLQPGLIRPGASGPDFWTARRDAVQGDG